MSYEVTEDDIEFLKQSNAIEGEGGDALGDSIIAWESMAECRNLSMHAILTCHSFLMDSRDTLPDAAKGKWTKVRTRVGPRLNPHPDEIPAMMASFVDEVNETIEACEGADDDCKASVAKTFHIRFEHIHPFQDGNGRVGRILYNWHRLRLGLPIHVIKESGKQAYYDWFR